MLRGLLFLLLALSLINCAAREVNDPAKAHLHLKIGTGHLTQGNYPQALNELLTAEKLNPDDPVIQNNLGLAFFVRNKHSEAETHLRRALELEPNYTEARNNLGRTLIELGLIDDAIKELEIATKDLTYKFPEQSQSNLGIAYFHKNQYAKAQQYLKESLRIRSSHCVTSNYFARTLFELKNFKEASLAFDQAANNCKNEKIDEPIYYGALSFLKLDNVEEARARFEEVLAQYPNGMYAEQSKKMLMILKERK